MAMATETMLLQNYVGAVNKVKELDGQLDKALQSTVEMLRGLKSGELALDRIVVTDNGWDIMPLPPSVNGHAPDPKVEAPASGGEET